MSWFRRWKRRRASVPTVGMQILKEGLALVAVTPGSHRALSVCEVIPHGGKPESGAFIDLVAERIETLGLKSAMTNVVLGHDDYQLLLVEAPNVPQAELREAVKWKVKDLVALPLEELVIDVITLPEDSSRNKAPLLYVVAAKRRLVEQIIEFVPNVGLELNAIDIVDMALRNLGAELADEERSIAMVHLHNGIGKLTLTRVGNLYLSRRFDIDYRGGLMDELPAEPLLLELQRSLDYFERQMGQSPPTKVWLSGLYLGAEKIEDSLRQGLSVDIGAFDLSLLTETETLSEVVPTLHDESLWQQCLPSIGVALREGEA
ncbi:MSHA biogenesis protein MshI [Marinibactrum halimedae]|uniref:MSHA biogenesis protein MshI n=1 Tax=Marinibactrum halimedae TaxID=1444977 RepID=A0AA37WPV8_9GAMM|nr:MSHA biogenesis protein MshI [Marinibactrum halimedae]MCD9460828.1 MSHA biogenesis protein MshI [Marinibactrum halimedae]GLS26707.1 hypothetical protein GCM10007877_24240 [Marinibactrum halimedae]